MTMKKVPQNLYDRWLRSFSADAVADDANELQRHIDYLQLGCSRADLILGTDLLVLANIVYLSMDGQDSKEFLERQRYWLCGDGLPHYILTFEMGVGHFGRLLADRKITGIDFADLFDHPWPPFESAGFSQVFISRLDGEPIEADEFKEIEKRVTEDMYYDFTEDEVSVTIQPTDLDDTVVFYAHDERYEPQYL